jgi:glycosyltransferase involved in cell wall biosynthesis
MRVALCHPTYWPEVRRGAERLAHDLAAGLVGRGHRTRIVTSRAGRPSRTTEDGIDVLRLWRPPGARLERRLFEPHVQLVPLTFAALRAGDDEIVQGLQAGDAAAAARWTRVTGRPSVYAHMGIPHRAWLTARRGRLRLVEEAVSGCSAVTALSAFARDAFHRWLGVEARVIAPPVDLAAFTPAPAERSEHPTVVCAADATDPRKRVGLLASAFAGVRREHPQARLLLDARTASALHDPAAGVHAVPMDDLPALYRQAWAGALPSWGEAFGLVLIEGLATGTPVVGSAGGAFPEIVDRLGIGRLFDGDEPEPLARALLETFELATDPATRAVCRARAEDFSQQRTVAAYAALYDELR